MTMVSTRKCVSARQKRLLTMYLAPVVASDVSLSTLTQAILAAGCAQRYSFAVVDPLDDTSGGQPGGNIRNAFLYDPTVVRLRNSTGGPGNATLEQMVDAAGHLIYNPAFVYPNSTAWLDSRRPLIAEWEFLNGGATFITISTHWTSKGGGSSVQGDARPPVNGGIDQRTAQATATAVSAHITIPFPTTHLTSPTR